LPRLCPRPLMLQLVNDLWHLLKVAALILRIL
jgi:hypothetical protein